MTKKRIRNVFLALLFICLAVVLPINLGLPQLALERALVLAFGVDKVSQGYELSAQVMVPQSNQSGYTEKREVKSEMGKTIDQALANLRLKVGRKLALAHTNVIVVSDSAIGDNILNILDLFMRSRDIGNYAVVVSTPDSAKEVLTVASQEDAGADMLLSIINFSHKFIYGQETTIDEIMHGYYSPSKTSLLSRLELSSTSKSQQSPQGGKQSQDSATEDTSTSQLKESQSNGVSQEGKGQEDSAVQGVDTANQSSSQSNTSGDASRDSGSGGGAFGGGASSATSSSQPELDNNGSVVVLKEGKAIKILDAQSYRGFHWLMPIKTTTYVELNGLNDENLKNATVIVKILDAKDSLSYEMTADNKPIIKFKTNLNYQISSTIQDEYDSTAYAEFSNDGGNAIKEKLQTLISSEIQSALQMSKDLQFDIWNMFDKFNQKFGKKFKKYVENNEGDYLKDIEIFVEVQTKEKKF